ncbi:MAG TPA: hypothetical protein VFE57_08255, partial [Cyclobacteriaceae bacterium]|nr:hypothetical protein [Cyclobacteriaceae bacterium]
MKSFILLVLFLTTLKFASAQSQFPLTYHLVWGGGKSHLQSNQDTIPKFSSLEFRFGLELQKPLNNRLEIVTRIAFGFKNRIPPNLTYHPIRTMPRMRLEAIT